MKKAIIVGLALIPILLFITSCGVAQEEYDRVSSDLAAAQTQIQSLQGELSTKETELSAKETELSAKETELSAKETELEAAEEKLEQGKARIEILNAIFIPAMTGELDRMTEAESVSYFFEWRDKIMDVGDPVLIVKFEAMMEAFSDEALLSFFVYMLESTADALE